MAVTTDPLKTGLADFLNPSFTTVTVSGLTAGRVVYTGTGGLLSADAGFTWDGTTLGVTGAISATTSIKTGTTTVDRLGSAAEAGAGTRWVVTDANSTSFASVVTGGGGSIVPVYSDGTDWRIG